MEEVIPVPKFYKEISSAAADAFPVRGSLVQHLSETLAPSNCKQGLAASLAFLSTDSVQQQLQLVLLS